MHQLTRFLRLGLLAAGVALAGCGGPDSGAGFRDGRTMIASAALFDPTRFAGDWRVVADFAAPGTAACPVTPEQWALTGPGRFSVSGTACAGGRGGRFDQGAAVIGPGRIAATAPGWAGPGTEPLWVLWVDAGYRIAAIGTPSGRFGLILSREAPPRPDLLAAAREALDFNGYDLARLRAR